MKLLYWIALAVVLNVGCEEKVKPSILSVPQTDIPSQESWKSTVTFSDSAKVKAILWAGYIAAYAPQQYTVLSESLRVDFFNEFEQHTSFLTAQWGRVDDRTHDFAAYENVVVISDSGTILRTDSLFWKDAERKIYTTAFVEITSPTEQIMGHGLVSDQGLQNYKITRVTGKAVTRE